MHCTPLFFTSLKQVTIIVFQNIYLVESGAIEMTLEDKEAGFNMHLRTFKTVN